MAHPTHYVPTISRPVVAALFHEAKRHRIPMTRLVDNLRKLADAYAEPKKKAPLLLKELLKLKAARSIQPQDILDSSKSPLHDQGIFGKMVFKAISAFRGGNLSESHFDVVQEPGEQQALWESREFSNSVVIQLGQKNYRVRVIVSEEEACPDLSK